VIRRLDHVAVAVADTEAALRHFRDRLGLEVVAVDEPPEVPVRLTYLDLGNTWLQLVEPLDPAHPLAQWLEENGDGLHHICFGVDDVECELLRLGPPGVPVPPLGSGTPAAACALAKAVGKSRAIPITSPVERISGPSSASEPSKRSNGSTASLTET